MPRKRETPGQGPLRKLNVTDKKKLFEQNGLKLVLKVFRGGSFFSSQYTLAVVYNSKLIPPALEH